ncbi:GNAT family N-acetyltransferase [Alteribacter aurantiacus]|uniref:GNAT family N-acetyltransferase n=1 Tax=Alteribacter aurantiacus TaxID=254410 RepID=UPI0004184814
MWHLKRFDELDTVELYAILKERVDVFVVEQNCSYPELDNIDFNSFHLFKKENKEIAGYLRIIPPGNSHRSYRIGRVIVNKSFRQRGLGNELMSRAMSFILTEKKATMIELSAQEYIQHFYESHGFKPISDLYLEDGIPHVEMLYKKEEES